MARKLAVVKKPKRDRPPLMFMLRARANPGDAAEDAALMGLFRRVQRRDNLSEAMVIRKSVRLGLEMMERSQNAEQVAIQTRSPEFAGPTNPDS